MRAFSLGLLAGAGMMLGSATASSPPNAAVITRLYGFKNAGLCTFQPAGEKLFEGLGKLRYGQSLRLHREIGGLELAIDGRRTSVPDPSGGSDDWGETVAKPIRPVSWYGFPVRSFVSGYEQPAESDYQYWREVRLDASPAQARALLRQVGVKAPAGGYHSIKDDHPCGGALSVQGKAGATTIRCAWGC